VWISPFDQETEVAALVEELGLNGMVAILHCDHIQMPGLAGVGELARGVWNLEPLADHYRDFNRRVEAFVTSLERAGQGKRVDAEAIFFAAMDLQNELMEMILAEDPCLPAELVPPGGPGRQTHELINTLTRTIDRLDQVSGRYDYLFHLIQGMEVLEAFRFKGDDAFHWPHDEVAQ
jgi:DNA-binding transcriptional regulator PaaX